MTHTLRETIKKGFGLTLKERQELLLTVDNHAALKKSHAELLAACRALIGPGKNVPFMVATGMAMKAISAAESLEVKP